MTSHADPQAIMQLALEQARFGEGDVEPNPMVGAVVASADRRVISVGCHQKFGDAHAEVNAIREAGAATAGNDLYVTLEPCSHFGKTPPCVEAVIAAGFRRVFIGCQDPAPHAAGAGIRRLRDAGLQVTVGVCESEALRLIAPFEMLMRHHRPWVHAKWAMTLDGRIASRSGHSRWISSDASRTIVHELRGRMDAVITGAGTVRSDNPLLTARPAGKRVPLRVVLDAAGTSLDSGSNLVRTLSDGPVLVCVADGIPAAELRRLEALGVELLCFPVIAPGRIDLNLVMAELGRRGCTNVLTEAGSGILGSLFDSSLIDEVHIFIAPRIVGGTSARAAIGGQGLEWIPKIPNIKNIRHTSVGDDMLIEGDVDRS